VTREVVKASGLALLVTLILASLIVVGSRRLAHFDAALVAYTFATLFAAFGITYRYAMWLQRPPTALYWRRSWQLFFTPGHWARNFVLVLRRVGGRFLANDFIWRRGRLRWVAHWLILWGCVLAAAITFPLVFGWVHFETVTGDLESYRAFVFGFPTAAFRTESLLGTVVFHGLVIASFLVIAGVMLAMRRRMKERGAGSVQSFGEDILPLAALLSISVTGLLLWISYTWMHGYAYEFLAIIHALCVILTLLWLPFGKLFHIVQRPAQIGVEFYKDAAASGEQEGCGRCGEPFASRMQVEDLIKVEAELGYQYTLDGSAHEAEHYQRICPRCRRVLVALTQGRLMRAASRPRGTGQV